MLHSRKLVYINEIVRCGSIRKAARVLNVSPSAVNRFVLEMEADLGAPIFERLPKGLKLTTSGEMLVTHIRETLHAHDRMRAQIKALKGLGRGEVTIATMQTLAAGRLAEVVADFRDAHPQINLCVMVGNRPEVIDWVASGQAELALAYNLPQDARLRPARLQDEPLGLASAGLERHLDLLHRLRNHQRLEVRREGHLRDRAAIAKQARQPAAEGSEAVQQADSLARREERAGGH